MSIEAAPRPARPIDVAPGRGAEGVSAGRRATPLGAILIALTVAGAIWRVAALRFNIWPHGDVVLDAGVAESLAWRGVLLVPFVDVRFYPIDRFGFGYPMDQHPPLWPLLGAPLVWLAGDGYLAVRLLSLMVGIVVVPLSYLACRPLIGQGPALLTAALVAGSYPLVDFAGNGSLWVLLAVFYLLFVWRTGACGLDDRRNAIVVGVIMGLGYLTNYPAVTLPIALVGLQLLRRGRGALERGPVRSLALSLAVMGVVISPWLVHNVVLFGNPFWSQPFERTLAGGSKQVEYLVVGGELVKRSVPSGEGPGTRVREQAINVYGNVGFVARQLLILAPMVVGFFAVGVSWWLWELVARRMVPRPGPERPPTASDGVSAIVVLAIVHLALILWWPTTKFRYLVPLLPLVFAAGSWLVWQIRPASLRGMLASVSIVLCLFTNLWTFVSIPSHTYYFNGGLVPDNFGAQGETAFVDEARRFRAAADAILARGHGTILADHPLYSFTHYPVVINSTAYPREVIAHLVGKYGIRYVVAPHSNRQAYDFLGPTEIWADDRFVALELPR